MFVFVFVVFKEYGLERWTFPTECVYNPVIYRLLPGEKKIISLPASEQLLVWCAAEDTGFPVLLGAIEFCLTNQLHLSLFLDSSEICDCS